MTSSTDENININWEEVILKLQAYTRSLVSSKVWFRGNNSLVFLRGKEVEDYVFDAIEKYLRNPEKFDSSKGTLINYLKLNLIRSMVSNDLVSAENKTTKVIFHQDDEYKSTSTYLELMAPNIQAWFDEEIDYNEVLSFIEGEVKGDEIVENIFFGICGFDMKRQEIIKEFNMTEKEFDNGMRRLNTIRKRAQKKYDIKSVS